MASFGDLSTACQQVLDLLAATLQPVQSVIEAATQTLQVGPVFPCWFPRFDPVCLCFLSDPIVAMVLACPALPRVVGVVPVCVPPLPRVAPQQLTQHPSYGVCLAMILANPQVPTPLRQASGVHLRRYCIHHWGDEADDNFLAPAVTDEAKAAIRDLLPVRGLVSMWADSAPIWPPRAPPAQWTCTVMLLSLSCSHSLSESWLSFLFCVS